MASAIIKPDPDELPPAGNGLKRRQSEEEAGEQESKRQRISPGKSSPPTATVKTEAEAEDDVKQESLGKQDTPAHEAKPTESIKPEPESDEPPKRTDIKEEEKDKEPPRRRSVVTDEKQRSKRLFGALLGNLNQPSDRTSKRRQENEVRKQAELQRRDEERNVDKLRRLEALTEHRRKVQKKVDEENTSSEPKLVCLRGVPSEVWDGSNESQYYRPWELRPDEEDRIEIQIKEAEGLVEIEAAEFEGRPVKVAEPVGEVGSGSPARTLIAPIDGQAEVQPTTEDPPNATTTTEEDQQPRGDDEFEAAQGKGLDGEKEKGVEQEVPDSIAAESQPCRETSPPIFNSSASLSVWHRSRDGGLHRAPAISSLPEVSEA
ncbi:hypothetical protein LTR54_010054 [Friedmanniomyces endolithicus]|nr:hypothetical protein LTS00_015805 [Friedmanniomyces endolithicus]KAK0996976.1 hypothetical protein LTR54_010054 [Friedmanniomyces endolithicus]